MIEKHITEIGITIIEKIVSNGIEIGGRQILKRLKRQLKIGRVRIGIE